MPHPPGQLGAGRELSGDVPWAGVRLQTAVSPNTLVHLEHPGEQMPGHVCSGLLDIWSSVPTPVLGGSPQVRPKSPFRWPAPGRVPQSL